MRLGSTQHPQPTPAEAEMLALYDQFDAILSQRGQQAARNFVASLKANMEAGMKVVYVSDNPRLEPTMPKGGLLTELQQAADAAKAALTPLQEDLKEYSEQRRVLRARLAVLSDPDSYDQMAEMAETEIKIKLIDRKLAKISAEIEAGPGRDWAIASRTYNLAYNTACDLERKLLDDAQAQARDLANLYYHTGKPEHAVLTCEVPK